MKKELPELFDAGELRDIEGWFECWNEYGKVAPAWWLGLFRPELLEKPAR